MTTGNKKIIIWILVPLIYGFISNILIVPPLLNQLIFTVFWFWVGIKISRLSGNKLKSFVIGNSIWFFSLLLYLWQFVLLNDESRNRFLALISQYYMIPFLWSGTKLTLMFSDVLDGTIITITSYLSMNLIFTVGFIVGLIMDKVKVG